MKPTIFTSEQWKTISRFPHYQVSNQGCVRRVVEVIGGKLGILSPYKVTNGYFRIALGCGKRRKTFGVHSLVATAFIGLCPEGYEVNHCDGKKENNSVSNLEYVTKSQNSIHAIKLGLKKIPRRKSRLGSKQVSDICHSTDTHDVIAVRHGISSSYVCMIRKGVRCPSQ